MPITQEAIDHVPLIKINGFTGVQNLYIQQQHKELLRFALCENDSKECAFVFRKDFVSLVGKDTLRGDLSSVSLGNLVATSGSDVFLMHNHPKNGRFSVDDITTFIDESNITYMSVVKHNGEVEIISKTSLFMFSTAVLLYKRVYRETAMTQTGVFTDEYLSRLMRKGLIIWKKQ